MPSGKHSRSGAVGGGTIAGGGGSGVASGAIAGGGPNGGPSGGGSGVERTQTEPARAARAARASARPVPPARLGTFDLVARIDEEIGRASRHRSSLCCLLVQIGNLAELTELHGEAFAGHALEHVGEVLRTELRRYDRVGHPLQDELVVVLPGAARQQGEAVARRALLRLRAIKVEIEQVRQPLTISVGIAAWSEPWSAERLIEEARAAAVASGCALED